MKFIIVGIDVLAWRSVLVQWEAPVIVDDNGFRTPKTEETWTEEELKKAKYNARALSAIHSCVTKKTFELIQGCETAKEAWDLLQTHFEGTTKVQSSRRDMMASRFENMRMEERESISDFGSRLKSLAQEAATLGKKYKDKKLVKKFLRCLPARFMAYKSALNVSHNTEDLSFGEVVGMLQAHEMELDSAEAYSRKNKNLALTSCKTKETEDRDPMSLLVRRFDRALRRIERGQGQKSTGGGRNQSEGDKQGKKAELQCHECKGYGHFKSECPSIKRREMKCSVCKGVGHTQLECVGHLKQRKEKSMMAEEEDSEADSENEEILNNLVSFVGIMEEAEGEQSESDENELIESYKEVRETLIRLGQENLSLAKEKQRLEAQVESLQSRLQDEQKLSQESVSLLKEKLNLAVKAANLEKELHAEKKISAELQSQLDLQYKKIRMFAGTRQLDHILSYGRTEAVHRGLGYNGSGGSESHSIKFVAASSQSQPANRTEGTEARRPKVMAKQRIGCYFCGRHGHIRSYCYKYWERVRRLRYEGKFTWNGSHNQIWVKKSDLRSPATRQRSDSASQCGFRCSMAIVTEEHEDTGPWYFDSDSSRHMTGTLGNLESFKKINKGKVTFGDGGHGRIQGKGHTCDAGLPKLMNVYLVQGLKANLISVSQLCDEGLMVCFTKHDCKAIDDKGKTVLMGVRTGNNCYMWKREDTNCSVQLMM